jgi:hypothetical protein
MTVSPTHRGPWTWRRSRWLAVMIGVVAGAAVGAAVYQGSQLTGRGLYILIGTTAGAVAAIVAHAYSAAIRLADVTVSVPQFSSARFVVTPDSRLVAWRLFIESITRVSLQPLDADAGLLREAMDSLYSLFRTTRQILADTAPSRRTTDGPTVEHLAISMLNHEIRPFLSRWHPQLTRWEKGHPEEPEHAWPAATQCRGELAQMQRQLAAYSVSFGRLAGLRDVEQVMWTRSESAP